MAGKSQLEQLELKLQVQAKKLSDSGTLAQSILSDSSRKMCGNKITLGNREQSSRGEQTRNLAVTPRAELTVNALVYWIWKWNKHIFPVSTIEGFVEAY